MVCGEGVEVSVDGHLADVEVPGEFLDAGGTVPGDVGDDVLPSSVGPGDAGGL
jgi:hypothetical protein